MTNMSKFVAIPSAPITATEPPEWVQKMNDHYAKTGTVRAADASRFEATTHRDTKITASAPPPSRNDDNET